MESAVVENTSAFLSAKRDELKRFSAEYERHPLSCETADRAIRRFLTFFKSWDFLTLHNAADIAELFRLCRELGKDASVPENLKEQIRDFVRTKITVLADLSENRDSAEQFFSLRTLLPADDEFRRSFIRRFIQWEAYHAVLGPLHEVAGAPSVESEAEDYRAVKKQWLDQIKHLAESYGESDCFSEGEEPDFPVFLQPDAALLPFA